MEPEISCLAEFKDKNIENEFHESEVKKGLRTSRNMVLIFSIINLILVIWDYLYLKYADISVVVYHSLIPRIAILVLGIIVYILLNKAPNKIAAIKSVIVYAILMYLLHEYIAIHFAPMDLIFEALDLVIMTFCLFIIPNRWITNICAAAFFIGIFVVLTPFTIPTLTEGTKILIALYLISHVLVVSVFDIDNFKRINDTYGHIAGDEVIVRIIDTVKGIIREDDIVARWGGEEFIIILPRTILITATEIANRIKEFIATIEHDRIKERVTASFGVTEFKQGDDMKSIINRADQLLYLAKEYGKNRVVSG
ncbi:MAG: hypothetical protein APF81_01405 [Desulfosporosinus sp. BRH_c37]|nr:MAG: hypothetical protein APF81_01405 [Desulfosporosinus sp. BRH_c37]